LIFLSALPLSQVHSHQSPFQYQNHFTFPLVIIGTNLTKYVQDIRKAEKHQRELEGTPTGEAGVRVKHSGAMQWLQSDGF